MIKHKQAEIFPNKGKSISALYKTRYFVVYLLIVCYTIF